MAEKTVFDYLKSINDHNYDYDDNENKTYNQYIINKGLSYFPDTILFVNEINGLSMTNRMHYEFLFNIVDKRNRYSKWFKPEESKFTKYIAEYYDVSFDKAKEFEKILSQEEKDYIVKILNEVMK